MTNKKLMELAYEYGKVILLNRRRFLALLPEIDKRKLYKSKYPSIFIFAAQVAGISRDQVSEVLRIERKLPAKLRKLIPEYGYSKLKVVATVATTENEQDLIDKVKQLPKSALQKYVNEMYRPGAAKEAEKKIVLKGELRVKFLRLQKQIEQETHTKLTDVETIDIILDELIKPEPKPKKTKPAKSRHIPVQSQRDALNKSNHLCAYPNCSELAEEFHYPERYSHSQNHDNVQPLCHEHHQIAHAGLIANEHLPPAEWHLRKEAEMSDADRLYWQYASR